MEKDLKNHEHRWRMKEWAKTIFGEERENDLQCLALNPNGVCYLEPFLKDLEEIKIKQYRHRKYYDKKHLFSLLSTNPSAMYILEKYKEWISWSDLNSNESSWAIDMLRKNPDKIEWNYLSGNPYAIDMTQEYFNDFKSKNDNLYVYLESGFEIQPIYIASNPNPKAIDIVEYYIQLYLKDVSHALMDEPFFFDDQGDDANGLWTNPSGIPLIEKYYLKNDWFIHWEKLSSNPNAKEILERNWDQIDWDGLSLNTASWAIEWLKQNQDKIHWSHLSKNASAIGLLEENQDKIDWQELGTNLSGIHLIESNLDKSHLFRSYLFSNPAIFELDYDFLTRRMNIIRDELMEKTWHPSRFEEWCL